MEVQKLELDSLDSVAELFAIIKSTEKLEKAFMGNTIPCDLYESESLKLIAQFKALSSSVPSIKCFARDCKLDCPNALNRLFISGVPATMEHCEVSSSVTVSVAAVAQCVQHFITTMNAIKLNMIAVDQVQPLLTDLSASLNKLTGTLLAPYFKGKVKVLEWLVILVKMGAADELTEKQARQLHFDLETAYNSYMDALENSDKKTRERRRRKGTKALLQSCFFNGRKGKE